jgi:hypothetical protein
MSTKDSPAIVDRRAHRTKRLDWLSSFLADRSLNSRRDRFAPQSGLSREVSF